MIPRPDLKKKIEAELAKQTATVERREAIIAAHTKYRVSPSADNYDALYNLLHSGSNV